MLKKVVFAFGVLVGIFAIVVARQPADFNIARSVVIKAPAQAVFDQVDDFHNWEAWSPWAKLDPNMKKSYEGAPKGGGAVHTWAGNNQVGEGRMTIMQSRAPEVIRIKLEFIKPMKATDEAVFTFQEANAQTTVTWSMAGKHNFMGKAFSLFADMDRMVGGDFERGLAALKAVVEAPAAP